MFDVHRFLSRALFFFFFILVANCSHAMDVEFEKKPSCAPKRLTHENIRAIFAPTDADYEKIETEKGHQKRVKTRVTIQGKEVDVFCAPKTFKAESISHAIADNPGKAMIGLFQNYMIKERADHTLAKSGLDKAAIAGYKLYWKGDNGRSSVFNEKKPKTAIEDPTIVYIAFATKAEWLVDKESEEIPPAMRAFKTLSREMLLTILKGGDQPVPLIGKDNREGHTVTAYYKAKLEDRDKEKRDKIIKLLEEISGDINIFAKARQLYDAGNSDTMTTVSNVPHKAEDWIYRLYSQEVEKKRKVLTSEDLVDEAERRTFSQIRLTFYKPAKKN
jgi:hypothetical protein